MSRAVDKAYAAIREGIVTGVHAPASRLREEYLAEAIGVSRTPVREALRRLAQEGLVDLTPNLGAFVTTWSPRDLDDMFSVRALVEVSAAGLAATRLAAGDIARLNDLAIQMQDLAERQPRGFLESITDLNHEFHTTIVNAAENQRMSRILAQTVEFPVVHRTFRRYRHDELLRSLGHHRELVAAFVARDREWAEAVMKCHILAAKHALLSSAILPLAERPAAGRGATAPAGDGTAAAARPAAGTAGGARVRAAGRRAARSRKAG